MVILTFRKEHKSGVTNDAFFFEVRLQSNLHFKNHFLSKCIHHIILINIEIERIGKKRNVNLLSNKIDSHGIRQI